MRYEISANKTGIPGRRKQYWGTSTWYALLQPSVLLQFCGYGVWIRIHDGHPIEKLTASDLAHFRQHLSRDRALEPEQR